MTQRTIVAVSGPANVGKSTQLRRACRRAGPHATLMGPLHEDDPRWNRVQTVGMASWWFADSTPAVLVDVLATSYLARMRRPELRVQQIRAGPVRSTRELAAATLLIRRHGVLDVREIDFCRGHSECDDAICSHRFMPGGIHVGEEPSR